MNGRPVIIGGGAGGLTAALCLAPLPVTLLCAGALGEGTASGWAQGGIAAALGSDDDIALHAADTRQAGAGLCDAAAVARITGLGPWAIKFLLALGGQFAMQDGRLSLGLEAAHSRRRIVHAADATGAEVMRVLCDAVRRAPGVTVIEHARVREIATADHAVAGLYAATPRGILAISTSRVILATGGIGGLFAHTTNPLSATGSGLALAARAGAMLRDMEFVQFHPTALACGEDPMPLVSEAVRGEGALFVDAGGRPFLPGGELAARDIVARAVAAEYAAGGKVFLDARKLTAQRFPRLFSFCLARAIDPAAQLLPVRPAAHYHMGGIAVDAEGESSLRGLFAIGEVAASGLHGANRLASNSLLEALATAKLAAAACAGRPMQAPARLPPPRLPPHPDAALPVIREICSENLGILRDAAGLAAAMERTRPLAASSDSALLAWLLADAAARREESRGAHFRSDFPGQAARASHSGSHIGLLPGRRLAA